MMNQVVYICEPRGDGSLYQLAERKFGDSHDRRLIDGTITSCGKCVGYCMFQDHPGFLTKQQRQAHNCITKQCMYYAAKPKAEAECSVRFSDCFIGQMTIRRECV